MAPYGVAGKILWVDLSRGEHWTETIPDQTYRQFLGGYGLGVRVLYEKMPAGADPLGPDNVLSIVAGIMTGVETPFSGRTQTCAKSPLTGTWADSNSGGLLGSKLKKAGYDGIFIRGKSEKPVYVFVEDDRVEIRDASQLWGKDTYDTYDALMKEIGGRGRPSLACIGPAGERGQLISCVIIDRYHAWGRQGFGAVWGSKNLKAVVARGTNAISVAHPDRFRKLCRDINEPFYAQKSLRVRLAAASISLIPYLAWLNRLLTRLGIKLKVDMKGMLKTWHEQGTAAAVSMSVENGDAPVKNWSGVGSVDFPLATKSWKISDREVVKLRDEYLTCGDCPLVCKGIVSVKQGPYAVSRVRRPDYETLCGFGASLLNENLESIVAAHNICNQYGLDAVSTPATIAFAAELLEKGIITREQIDGLDLRWGNTAAIVEATRKMAAMEGNFGKLFGNGIKRASELVPGSEPYAVHVRGQELPYHDPKFSPSMGTNYLADPTPGRHTTGTLSWNETFNLQFPYQSVKLPKYGWRSYEGKGEGQRWWSNAHQVMNGMGICLFSSLVGGIPYVELTNAITGWGVDEQELLRTGERIQTLRHQFNTREGIKPADIKPHPRMIGLGDTKLARGPLAGIEVDQGRLVRDYYRAMGWDYETGAVKREKLEELGLTPLVP
jgi:aldehyde:ferredoxin oxidoreductase